jgi:uncharacterized integral membrane protein (TIGR00698 family)
VTTVDDQPAASDDAPGLASAVVARLPGLALLVLVALAARAAGLFVPGVNALLASVAIGIIVVNVVGVPDVLDPGVATHKLWLETGIVLMGARISVESLLGAGVELTLLVVVAAAGMVLLVEALSRTLFDVPRELGALLAAGSGICGVSAVAGVAGSIRANEDHVAYATATILLFDAVTLFVYPVLGSVLSLSDQVFGVWAGLTMFSTGPVTAAGFAFSETAGHWATVTKLTRNLLLGVLVGVYSLRYAEGERGASAFSPRALWASFPKFVLGFFAVMVLTSTALVSPTTTEQLTNAYQWLFLVAFAGLGLSVDVEDLLNTGARPVALVCTAFVVGSAALLVLVGLLFGA